MAGAATRLSTGLTRMLKAANSCTAPTAIIIPEHLIITMPQAQLVIMTCRQYAMGHDSFENQQRELKPYHTEAAHQLELPSRNS